MNILYPLLTAFAWAIGGEKYFGKWRRGVLVAIPVIIAGLTHGFAWHYYAIVVFLAWGVYQALCYDEFIKDIWPDDGSIPPQSEVAIGLLGLFFNGALAGIMPALFQFYKTGSYVVSAATMLLAGAAFIGICWLSNGIKWGWNGCYRFMEVKLWCPKDTWWWACWIFGAVLGGLLV